MITAVPSETPVTLPEELTVATLVFEDLNVTAPSVVFVNVVVKSASPVFLDREALAKYSPGVALVIENAFVIVPV